MAQQQAWIVERKGLPKDALSLRKDWPVPSKLGKGEVLVKVEAAALNPAGYKTMGLYPDFLARRPMPAEYDLAGIIEDANDSAFSKGDRVFGYIPTTTSLYTRQGALQQYVRLAAACLVIRPDNVTATQAAGFTLVGETALQALFDHGHLEPDQSVLINGGSSSVGSLAIQIAKAKGARRVVATCSTKNIEFVRGLGADEVIDYTKQPLHEYLSNNPPATKFHVILDAVSLSDPSLFIHSPAYLSPGGTFVFVASPKFPNLKTLFAWSWPAFLGGIPRRLRIVIVKHNPSDLEELKKLITEGKLKPVVDSVYEFEDALAAYDRIMTSRARGKVVIKVDPSAT